MPKSWLVSVNVQAEQQAQGNCQLNMGAAGPEPGDTVYLYRQSLGDLDPGIYAVGEVTASYGNQASVRLDPEILSNKRQFIKETTLLRDPGLKLDKDEITQSRGVFRLSSLESRRLQLLAKKAGKDYDEVDSMRCLLAYEECVAKQLNIDSSAPVITAALETGRLITSVAFKLANFRSLDPRSTNTGFIGAATVDKAAWQKYYLPDERRIDVGRLRSDLAEKELKADDLFIIGPDDEKADLDMLPDDEELRQKVARRIRRGQSRFRKALLTLYENRCAFTGVFEDRALEACHILPHARFGNNQLANGLILRADVHTLFDLHLMTVANDGLTVRVSPEVTDPEFKRLNLTKQSRASASEQHRDILAQRNRDITWLS